jgi:gliding motility-associated-like protein
MRKWLIYLGLLLHCGVSQAQYISRSEPVPYTCPVVCAGGELLLKVPQVQNFPNGTLIQAELSNTSGSFSSGSQVLNATRYSLNQGASYSNGAFAFTGNVNDLYFVITIPASTPVGSLYSIRMRSTTGYVSPDLFQCNATNRISITPFQAAEPAQPQTNFGNYRWLAHVYTWAPSTAAILNTPSLIAQQQFFNGSNYRGHVWYSPLNLSLNLSSSGGVPGSLAEGGSISCGINYSTLFSMRLKRRHTFAPGRYTFTIQGDDGIRLSIDGGQTWLLDSFIEQTYAGSFKSSVNQYPDGICLDGPVDLVLEYFQRPADARLDFRVIPVSQGTVADVAAASVCEGDPVSFTAQIPAGAQPLQWQMSVDGGQNFTNVNQVAPYSGVQSPTLEISSTAGLIDGTVFRLMYPGYCGSSAPSDTAVLHLRTPATDSNCKPVCVVLSPPNVFSPNGDGVNDTFFPASKCEIPRFKLEVFSRWGNLMYRGSTATQGWNGQLDGKDAPDGTYFYLLEYEWNGTLEKKQGYVQLIR